MKDVLDDFIQERCIVDPDARVVFRQFYDNFSSWYHANMGRKQPGAAWVGKRLGQKYTMNKAEGRIIFIGITLNDNEVDEKSLRVMIQKNIKAVKQTILDLDITINDDDDREALKMTKWLLSQLGGLNRMKLIARKLNIFLG